MRRRKYQIARRQLALTSATSVLKQGKGFVSVIRLNLTNALCLIAVTIAVMAAMARFRVLSAGTIRRER